MTLKLVADNGEAIEAASIGASAELRDLADRIDAGEYPETVRMIVVIETETTLNREILGKQATGFELIGIMEAVKSMTLSCDD
jgi:hypothetical protein